VNENIHSLARQCEEQVLELRRAIHRNPELSNEEQKTASLVASILRDAGLEVRTGIGGHGVLGLLEGARPGGCVALRADMDALPFVEKTGVPWASQVKGVMHACGHDTHTAMLLGAALVLSEMKDEIPGTVKFLFQPAEEANPVGGAPAMIAQGVLENPKVDAIFGLHVWPSLATGTLGTRAGALMGASDRLFITVKGKGSHGSEPENGVDAIAIAAQIITAIQTIVSRSVSPLDAAVISIGTIKGGNRYNVIADEVVLEGTVRTVIPETQEKMPGRIEGIARGIARGMGGDCDMEYVKGYPPLMNDPELARRAFPVLERIVGKENVVHVEKPALGGEDFSFFSKVIPSLFMWVGCRPEGISKDEVAPLHNNCFLPDEKALPLGVEVLVSCALEYLEGGRGD
jgi:amidohydrolase